MSQAEELHEHAEHAAHSNEPFNKRVAASMAIIAAILALVSVLGHMSTTEELLMETKASDAWAEYQAKSIRRYQSDATRDLLQALNKPGTAAEYAGRSEKYRSDQQEISNKAREFESESARAGGRARRFHAGEIFLEMAIVVSSLAILTRREAMFWAAVVSGLAGAAVAVSVFAIS
jgi:hypothetical protein